MELAKESICNELRKQAVVDTGGFTVNSDDIFEEEIRKQVMIAIEECDLVLFLTEVGTGITDFDAEIAKILRRSYKYTFIPTGIGTIGEIQCSCGETFTFQDLI